MNKKELFDALDGFSQELLVTLAEVEAIKKNLKLIVEENTALRRENDEECIFCDELLFRE